MGIDFTTDRHKFRVVSTDKLENITLLHKSDKTIISTAIYQGNKVILKKYLVNSIEQSSKELILNYYLTTIKANITAEIVGILYDESLTFIFEYIELDVIRYYKLYPHKYLDLFKEVMMKVYHLHTLGIIHVDLKLNNLMITGKGDIKIIDFGLSELLLFSPKVADTNFYNTSPSIKAPDKNSCVIKSDFYYNQQKMDIKIDRKSYSSDIYSLGQSFLHLLYQKDDVKFVIIDDNIYSYNHLEPQLRRENRFKIDNFSEDLFELFRGMLDLDSARRFTIFDCLNCQVNRSVNLSNFTTIKNPFTIYNRYSLKNLQHEEFEIAYIPSIIYNYRTMRFSSSKFHPGLDELFNWILSIKSKKTWLNNNVIIISFYIIKRILSVHTMPKDELKTFAIVCIYVCSMIYDSDNISISNILGMGNIKYEEFEAMYKKLIVDFHDILFQIQPVYIFIEYAVIELQKRGVKEDVILSIENFLFVKLTQWIIFHNRPDSYFIIEIIETLCNINCIDDIFSNIQKVRVIPDIISFYNRPFKYSDELVYYKKFF